MADVLAYLFGWVTGLVTGAGLCFFLYVVATKATNREDGEP